MTDQAVDFSVARPSPKEVTDAGYVGVLRYMAPPGAIYDAKRISVPEYQSYRAAGLHTGLVYETSAQRVLSGAPGGDSDGAVAKSLVTTLGWNGKFVYSAVDFGISSSQFALADAYFGAFNTHFPCEPYGDYDYIEHWCSSNGVSRGGWQTAAWSGSGEGSGGQIDGRRESKYARLYQRVGYTLGDRADVNDILSDQWGQDDPATTPEEDEVAHPVQAIFFPPKGHKNEGMYILGAHGYNTATRMLDPTHLSYWEHVLGTAAEPLDGPMWDQIRIEEPGYHAN